MATENILPITWITGDPIWVSQWPLSREKLQAAQALVQEQLALGHLKSSTSPWNTPIFVIKKKSGKWRLLHDLRAINQQMQPLGPIQRGLPLLSMIPKKWPIIALDIKDCFFSIPLCPQDTPRFAFTLPSINQEHPDQRFEWTVLPQGMMNSPTMCQIFVDRALQPVRQKFPTIRCIHYMDDILLAGSDLETLNQAFCFLVQQLESWGLNILPEKIQRSPDISFLGYNISPTQVVPQKVTIRTDHLHTLNDFQKLLGDINWVRLALKITTGQLRPLFDILKGDPQLDSPRELTPEARQALQIVEEALERAALTRIEPEQPISLIVLATPLQPTAVLWQEGVLLWVFLPATAATTLSYYPTMTAKVALKGYELAIQHAGRSPDVLIVPYTKHQVQMLAATIDDWAILVTLHNGMIDNHYPSHPILQFAQAHPFIVPSITRSAPLVGAMNIFVDGSKTGLGAYMVQHEDPVVIPFPSSSAQVVELAIVLEVFRRFHDPFNLISDSKYVVELVRNLECAGSISAAPAIAPLVSELQALIQNRSSPFYILHLRAHTGLPGPLVEGNAIVDHCTRMQLCFLAKEGGWIPQVELAEKFHANFHVNAETLRIKFHITRAQARDIVLRCKNCVTLLHPRSLGVCPKGLKPLHLWQMDVTHVPEFGTLKYVHVSVDTASGIIFASAHTGEKAHDVIAHCLEAWAAWGKPQILKTDNGSCYTSQKFISFCAQLQVSLKHGLPYNPQAQGIVERAHRTLKECLLKQKGGIGNNMKPKQRLSLSLFTLNFLQLDALGTCAVDRHSGKSAVSKGFVLWKDVLTGIWHGPDPVLAWARGSVCVFPQDSTDPVWVPERLTRRSTPPKDEVATDESDDPVMPTSLDAPSPPSGSTSCGEMGNP